MNDSWARGKRSGKGVGEARQRSVVLVLSACVAIALILAAFVWLTGPEPLPATVSTVKESEVSEAAIAAQSSALLVRAAVEQAPSGYIVAIDAISGTRVHPFYINYAEQLIHSSSLGVIRLANLPRGERLVVGAVGYYDEPLALDAITIQGRKAVALRPCSCDISVIEPDGQHAIDGYSLWAWSTGEQFPELKRRVPGEIRPGMCVYAVRGDDASDIVEVGSENHVRLRLRSEYASSLRIEFRPASHPGGGEVSVHPVRIHFPTMSNSRWLRLRSVEIDLPKIDTRLCAVPGQFRVDHERTKDSCLSWHDEGRVHTGRVDGSRMPRYWSAIVQEVLLPSLRVSDEEGRALSGAEIRTFFDVRNRGEWRESSYAGLGPPRTDRNGFANWTGGWLIEEISKQGIKIEISHLGYSTLTVASPDQQWGSSVGRVVLSRCPDVRIRVLRTDGAPFRLELVRVCADVPERNILAEVSTDEEGIIRMPLAIGAAFCIVCSAGQVCGQIQGAMTDVSLPAVRQAIVELPVSARADLVLVSSSGEAVSHSTEDDSLLVFSNLSSTEDYTVVPRGALDQYRVCRFGGAPDIIAGAGEIRIPCRQSWLDTPPSRAYIVAPDLPAESIVVIPWYGGPMVPLPAGHIPGRRLPVNEDYSVDLTGLHGSPSQLIAILRTPESGSDWLLGRSDDLVTVDCTVREVILAPSDTWADGTAMFLGSERLRWGAVCMTDGVRLTKDERRISRVPGLVERIVWRKRGLETASFDLPPGRGVWRISTNGVSRVR